jgi:hypothetical protein
MAHFSKNTVIVLYFIASVVDPFQVRFLEWEENGTYIGLAWEEEGSCIGIKINVQITDVQTFLELNAKHVHAP